MPPQRPPRRLDRSQLPEVFTPDTVRAMDMRVARRLARPGNGVLTPAEQQAFESSLREVLKESGARLGRLHERRRPDDAVDLDPALRRSYQQTQRRLEAQAERARRAFPQLVDTWGIEAPTPPAEPSRDPEVEPPTADDPPDVDAIDAIDGEDATDGDDDLDGDVSLGTFEAEVAQNSDLLDILEQIAGIQQQQLEHQRSQVLSETRGIFFALAVSVAVIIAGIAPLVEASPSERALILSWTAGVLVLAGAAYAATRAIQSRTGQDGARPRRGADDG